MRLLTCLLFSLCAAGLSAATITVTNLNDTGAGSLRDAVATAVTGDDIVFNAALAGTITLTSQIDFGAKVLTLTGNVDTNGKPSITLDGNNVTRIINGTSTMTLANLILTNGNSNVGSAVFAFGGSFVQLSFQNCVFLGNSTSANAAINTSGTVTCVDCTFRNNTATNGSSVLSVPNRLSLERCTFDSNSGGAACITAGVGPHTIENCTFLNNSGSFGVLLISSGGPLVNILLSISTFSGSTSADIHLQASNSGTLVRGTLDNCIFTNTGTNAMFIANSTSGGVATFLSGGYNLTRDTPSWMNAAGDQTGVADATIALGALQDNGGLVETMMPAATSPAVDAGNYVGADAHGISRP
ncbi:MAG: hypothetical protein L3J82_00540, partial [Planctomycetes bacterium]|nr:hypothetical protein [Planctomycetota bacterium]